MTYLSYWENMCAWCGTRNKSDRNTLLWFAIGTFVCFMDDLDEGPFLIPMGGVAIALLVACGLHYLLHRTGRVELVAIGSAFLSATSGVLAISYLHFTLQTPPSRGTLSVASHVLFLFSSSLLLVISLTVCLGCRFVRACLEKKSPDSSGIHYF